MWLKEAPTCEDAGHNDPVQKKTRVGKAWHFPNGSVLTIHLACASFASVPGYWHLWVTCFAEVDLRGDIIHSDHIPGRRFPLLSATGSRTVLAVKGTADISQSQTSSLWQENEGHATETRSKMFQRILMVRRDAFKTTRFCCMNNLQENLFDYSLGAFFFLFILFFFLNQLFHCL